MTNTLRLHAEHLNVLRGILAAEGRGDRGVENNEELNDPYCLPIIVRVIK